MADGRASARRPTEHPDLFWALRGGGGNFGVVTEFEFRLHEVGPMVQLGLFFWSIDRAATRCGRARRRRSRAARGDPGALIVVALNAPPAAVRPGVAPLRAGLRADRGRVRHRPRSTPRPSHPSGSSCRRCSSSSRRCRTSRCSRCSTRRTPGASTPTTKGLYLDDLTDDAVEVIAERAGRSRAALRDPDLPARRGVRRGRRRRHGVRRRRRRVRRWSSRRWRRPETLAGDRQWVRDPGTRCSPGGRPGHLRQHPAGGRRPDRARQLRRGEVRPPRPDQGRVRPGQRLHLNVNIKPA